MAYDNMADQMGPRRKALVDSLAGNTGVSGAMAGGAGMPPIQGAPAPAGLSSGAVGGLMDAGAKLAPGGSLAKPSGFGAAMGGITDTAAKLAPGGSLMKPAGPFQSGNASVSGYLTDAVRDFAPTVRGIKDEAGRKSALNQYLTSLAPEVEKRGGHLSDIHGDGANVDGRRIDFFRDIEGAADPQYLDVTDGGGAKAPMRGGMNPMFAGSSIAPMLQGDPSAGIQNALQQIGGLSNTSRLQQLIAQLSGGGQ